MIHPVAIHGAVKDLSGDNLAPHLTLVSVASYRGRRATRAFEGIGIHLGEGESQLPLQLRESPRDNYAITLQLLCIYFAVSSHFAVTQNSRHHMPKTKPGVRFWALKSP